MGTIKRLRLALVLLLLLLCGCKSKHSLTKADKHQQTEISVLGEKTQADTTVTIKTEQVKDWAVIMETTTVKEYDKEGNLSKETKTERKIAQGFDKVATEKKEEKSASNWLMNKHAVSVMDEQTETEEKIEPTTWKGFKEWSIIGTIIVIIWVIISIIRKRVRIKV